MYNGIGLKTVRGSASSGHVQRNLSHVHVRRQRQRQGLEQQRQWQSNKPKRQTFQMDDRQQRLLRLENDLLQQQEELEEYKQKKVETKKVDKKA